MELKRRKNKTRLQEFIVNLAQIVSNAALIRCDWFPLRTCFYRQFCILLRFRKKGAKITACRLWRVFFWAGGQDFLISHCIISKIVSGESFPVSPAAKPYLFQTSPLQRLIHFLRGSGWRRPVCSNPAMACSLAPHLRLRRLSLSSAPLRCST